jgi:hypothetical protein
MTGSDRQKYDAVAVITLALGEPIWGYDEYGPIWKDGTASYALNIDALYLRVAVDMDDDSANIARVDRAVGAATRVGIKCAVLTLTKREPNEKTFRDYHKGD